MTKHDIILNYTDEDGYFEIVDIHDKVVAKTSRTIGPEHYVLIYVLKETTDKDELHIAFINEDMKVTSDVCVGLACQLTIVDCCDGFPRKKHNPIRQARELALADQPYYHKINEIAS